MKMISLLPADLYTIINRSIITEEDKKNIISLYEPLTGPIAVSLYFTLLRDVKLGDFLSTDFTHHHLMCIMNCSLDMIKNGREALEAVGLLKTYYKEGEPNTYVYELYSPLSAKEFFASPIFNVALYNILGKNDYTLLSKEYTLPSIDLTGYEDISVPLNNAYKSSANILSFDTRQTKSLNVKLESQIDFDLLISSLPEYANSKKIFNKKVKELITELSFIYDLDTLKMADIIRNCLNENGLIKEDDLRKMVRKYYQYNNDGKLPRLVFKTQPDSLKGLLKDKTMLSEKIYMLENTTPYDYLMIKNKGTKPTSGELRLLEYLLTDLKLTPAVVNVLIDYVLKKNNNKLTKAYVETIASQWVRSNVKTVEEAMELAKKESIKKTKVTKAKKSNENVPSWLNKDIKKEEATEEEKREMDELLKDFR